MDYFIGTSSFPTPVFKSIDGSWIGLLILAIVILCSSIISIIVLFFLWRRYQQRIQHNTGKNTLINTTTGKRPIPVQIQEQPTTAYETQKMEVFVPTMNDERIHTRYPPHDDVEQVHRFYERTSKAYF